MRGIRFMPRVKYPRMTQDKTYSEMYRVEWSKVDVSDMVNKTRANDAVHRWEESERQRETRRVL